MKEVRTIKCEALHTAVAISNQQSAVSKIPKLKAESCELKRSFGVLMAEKLVPNFSR